MHSRRNLKSSLPLACLLLAMAAGITASAGERFEAWQAKHPFVQSSTGQHEPGGDRIHLEEFKGSGLNTAMDGRWFGSERYPVPESYGLPLIYFAYTPSPIEHFLKHWNEARARHKNMIAVLLGDELAGRSAEELSNIRRCRDWIVNNPDPAISGLVTIDSEASGDTVSANKAVQTGWNRSFEALRPDVWLAQFYPVGGGELVPSYYSSLEWYFNWVREKDLGMWCWLDTWSSSPLTIPSESELRLQRFTSLAYGMRGFVDFLWAAVPGGPSVPGAGYWDGSGKPTRIYRDLTIINREVASTARSLIRLKPIRAYHLDSRDDGDGVHHWSDSDADLPAWQRRTGRLVNLTAVANANHLLVGFFRDRAGEEYFIVVNKDFAKDADGAALATDVLLSFHPSVKSIQRLRRSDGKVDAIPVQNHQYTFSLPGGTGDLFKFATGSGFAGIDEVRVPTLLSAEPPTVCRLAGNSIAFTFDHPAHNVMARILKLDENGSPVGEDLSARFARTLSEGDTVLTYTEKGSAFTDRTRYRFEMEWAQGRVVDVLALRGDVDGDARITQGDVDQVKMALATKQAARADLDGSGQVDEKDLALMERILKPLRFSWHEDFESYSEGPLGGQGPWLACESIPGTVLSRSWVEAEAKVSAEAQAIRGRRSATSDNGGHFIGNEAVFMKEGGLGGVGVLEVKFLARVGTQGFHNHGLHLWNASDSAGQLGSLTFEITNASASIASGRGVALGEGTKSIELPAAEGRAVRDLQVTLGIDFGASTYTWSLRDLHSGKAQGPFKVPFTGKVVGLNALDVILRGEHGALDDIRIEALN